MIALVMLLDKRRASISVLNFQLLGMECTLQCTSPHRPDLELKCKFRRMNLFSMSAEVINTAFKQIFMILS